MTIQFCLFAGAYNTGNTIRLMLEGLADLDALLARRDIRLQVLLIDDASTDGTGQRLDEFAHNHEFVEVRHNETNHGNASNILSGYEWALERAGDGGFVACCDSDGEHGPVGFASHLDLLARGHFDGVAGTIIYPQHHPSWTDLNMMRFAGAIQSAAANADQPFYIQSPGWQLHRPRLLQRVIEQLLPAYISYYEANVGDFPRWGLHGVIDHLLAKSGARLHSAYLECFGQAPNRNDDKLLLQAKTCLGHLEVVERFWAEGAKAVPRAAKTEVLAPEPVPVTPRIIPRRMTGVLPFPPPRQADGINRPPYVTRWNGPVRPLADHGMFAAAPVPMRRQSSDLGKRLLGERGQFEAVVYGKGGREITLSQWLKLAHRLISIVACEYGSAVLELSTATIPVEREYFESTYPWYKWDGGHIQNGLHYPVQRMYDTNTAWVPRLLRVIPGDIAASGEGAAMIGYTPKQPDILYFGSDAGKAGRLSRALTQQMFYVRGSAPSFKLGVSQAVLSYKMRGLRSYEIEEYIWLFNSFTADTYRQWKDNQASSLAFCP